jgi:hypothetical protein
VKGIAIHEIAIRRSKKEKGRKERRAPTFIKQMSIERFLTETAIGTGLVGIVRAGQSP